MANSAAHSVRGGFNQSGGAYFMVLAPGLQADPLVAGFAHTIDTASTGSGGATSEPVLTAKTMKVILQGSGAAFDALTVGEAAALVGAGKLLKDMGETIVSAGRTFRKFQVAATGTPFGDSRGVAGSPAATPNNGYGTFYLDVTCTGATGAAPAPILRYF
jgi:hypothetical protein